MSTARWLVCYCISFVMAGLAIGYFDYPISGAISGAIGGLCGAAVVAALNRRRQRREAGQS